jgi:hypothetical protein
MNNSPGLRGLFFVTFLEVVLIVSTAGCSIIGVQTGAMDATQTPLATMNPRDELNPVPAQACLIAEGVAIQSDLEIGNLIAWAPDGAALAYITPANHYWGWYTGNLIVSEPGGELIYESENWLFSGDLAWSPDGSRLAAVALRAVDDIYTIGLIQLSSGIVEDLLGTAAAASEYTLPPGILRWSGRDDLQVTLPCGVDCIRILEIGLSTGEQNILAEERQVGDISLSIERNLVSDFKPPIDTWDILNWSPDNSLLFYTDRGSAWIAALDPGYKYRLELGDGEAQESRWSPDGKMLAVRTEERILVFRIGCSSQAEVDRLEE